MKVIQLMQRIHRKYAGDVKYPNEGSETWNLYLGHANDLKHDWATDPDNPWKSLLEADERSIGTISASKTYPLDDEVVGVLDYVFIDATNGQRYTYPVIKPEDRRNKSHSVFISSRDPVVLTFTNDMSDTLIGGTIRALCYIEPPDMTRANGTVPVDRPAWLALATAAELARNDPAKDDQFPDINGQANDEWQKMVSANNGLPAAGDDSVPISGFNEYGED